MYVQNGIVFFVTLYDHLDDDFSYTSFYFNLEK